MQLDENEDKLLRSVALQNANAVLLARERAERELVYANQRITNILESITDGFCALDKEWRFVFINRRAEEIFRPLHASKESLLGVSHWEAFPATVGTPLEEQYRHAMREQVTVHLEHFYPPLNCWFDIRVYPSPDGLSIYFQDITQRKRDAEELRQQHEWFVVTLASIGDAVITTDTESKVTFLNPVAEAMTGWKTGEAAGQPLDKVFRIINELSREPVISPVSKVLREGKTVALANHTALVARDGREIAIEDSAAPIKDVAGNISGVVMVFHEVTERRRAEQDLRESENRKSAILSAALDAIITMDHEGNVADFNPAAERIFGYARAEVVGKPLAELIIPERFRQRHYEGLKHYLATGEGPMLNKRMELPGLRADGSEFPAELSISAISGVGSPMFTATLRDITDRKRTQEALRESEERLRATFNQAAVGIAMAGMDGRFEETNQKFTEILGYSIQELRQLTFSDITHIEDLQSTQSNIGRLVAGEVADVVYEKRYVRKDGGLVWSLTTVTLLKDGAGKPHRFIGVIEDITQRKQAEVERERLTNVLERSLNEIYIFDTQTLRFEYVNGGARRNLGYSLEEMRRMTPLDIKPELTEAGYREMLKPLLAGEKEKHIFHTVHRRRDQTTYPVEVHLQPVTHAGHRVFLTVILDVTDRKKREDELRRSEEELRALANSIPQLAWMAKADGHIFWYNHKWYEYTGTTFQDMEGWGWESVHDPKILPLVLERWTESVRTGQPFEMEFPLRGADGVFRWFLTRVNAVRDAEGRVVRWFGTNTDVDTVRRAQEALRDETRILELLNDTGRAIAAKLDLQSLVQTVTDSATQLTGAQFGAFFYNVINAQGESFLLYTLSGAPREAFEKFGMPRNTPVFNHTFAGHGVVRSGDITKDPRYGKMSPHHGMPKGHLPVRSYLAVPVSSRSGEVIGGLFFGHSEPDVFPERAERLAVGVAAQAAVAIDNARLYDAAQKEITRRTKAEVDLAGRVRLAVLRAEISAALAVNEDLPSVLQRCAEALVKHIDAAFARIWTASDNGILELRASAGIYTHLDGPHSRIRIGEFKIGRIAQNREPHLTNDVQNDSNISDPDWARREGMVAFAGYPLVVEDHSIGVVALFARRPLNDEVPKELSLIAGGLAQWIQRKQAEQALRAAQEELGRHAESLEKQVALRTASLREAIAQLEEFSYSVSHDLRAPLRAIAGYTQILGVDHSAALPPEAQSLLDKITRSTERMQRLVNDVLTISRVARAEIQLHPIALQQFIEEIVDQYPEMQAPAADLSIAAPHLVMADDASLVQVISNLLANAVKFVPEGTRPVVHVWSEQKEDRVRIWVEDNGIGIPLKHRAKLFGMFQRLPAKVQYEGTGIGLAIVRKAVERMGGTAGIESNGTSGSQFWVELKGQ